MVGISKGEAKTLEHAKKIYKKRLSKDHIKSSGKLRRAAPFPASD
jgi:hypothetical protein